MTREIAQTRAPLVRPSSVAVPMGSNTHRDANHLLYTAQLGVWRSTRYAVRVRNHDDNHYAMIASKSLNVFTRT
jgi:hypothetical protein